MLITIDNLRRSGLCRVDPASVAPALDAACARFAITTPARLAGFLSQCSHESNGFSATRENLNYSASLLVRVFPRYFDTTSAKAFAGKPEAIANRVYGGRLGNRGEASGDGWRFRGRGFVQLTGRANYSALATALGRPDVLTNPDAVALPELSALSAAWFWATHGLNEIADRQDGDALADAMREHRKAALDPTNPAYDFGAVLSVNLGIDAALEAEADAAATGPVVLAETQRINGGTNGLDDRRRLYDLARKVFA